MSSDTNTWWGHLLHLWADTGKFFQSLKVIPNNLQQMNSRLTGLAVEILGIISRAFTAVFRQWPIGNSNR